ncbi:MULTISPECIES: NAD(P)-binding domain-containing protein [Staphylococcus]|uniref:NAD(P)-binding domain-containing protein n=1 Tax=Staphylococcus TaxID=1279 RepID=UPI0008A5176C|nr:MULTISPECIES: NAD(P)-binding domain-containing protein [Staphylococcus]ARJ14443.1 pyridine nucleotide-disulfide oxidoreductase [Staphylococcus lugdunensis]MCH8666019.1 NAD(P)-binding domain-containing protein [Staphylococcus lugdunensis]OFJ65769.1 pyridine nucleotide-disulfide oxidoreductase [Staphylococcus sp. HMSC077E11]OFM43720.1 pyridine nucleotide-disulfide oxidoreductase [Staphylococcus sp. HMSC077E12]OFR90647.1 pyridine nucleotide-disulfide oxidoreductase [Staphylococcus sp. HMSC059F
MHWTIIGGGLQGTTIAIKLRHHGLPLENLTIIDPYASLCEQFNQFSQRIRMPFLRSPFVHHCHPNPFHLKQFAKYHQYTGATYGKYKRPQRDMFMDHTHQQIHDYNLNMCHRQGKVSHIRKQQSQWQLELQDGTLFNTDCVVLANGCNHQPYIPDIFQQQPDITHIFQTNIDETIYQHTSHVVGSGISAAHLTLKLIDLQPDNTIHLWMNKQFEIHDFDADPGWLGPKNMNRFLQIESSQKRMAIINQERHKGSLPHELYLRLKKYVSEGRLIIHQSPIKHISDHHCYTEQEQHPYNHILLATGFKPTLLQQPMVKNLIQQEQAPITMSGFPQITSELEWLPQLFVAGGLADLELGPFARNIMGGRDAAERIYQAYQRLTQKPYKRGSA